jgi:hypothetical protein
LQQRRGAISPPATVNLHFSYEQAEADSKRKIIGALEADLRSFSRAVVEA